jgi:hypothetical protein
MNVDFVTQAGTWYNSNGDQERPSPATKSGKDRTYTGRIRPDG